jgi:D-serine deaminase-like pyridoxal phosphate-dependent protein
VYFDANQVRLGSASLDECALTVLSTVVSTQRPGTAIIDAGLKAMSSDAIATAGSLGIVCDLMGRPLSGVVFSDGNEEHGFLTGTGVEQFAVGDQVRVIPNHACGTTNMFSQVHAVQEGAVIDVWPISARH